MSLCVIASLLILLTAGCNANDTFSNRLDMAVSPYRFSIAKWEIEALSGEISEFLADNGKIDVNQSQTVVEYFNIMAQIDAEQQAIGALADDADDNTLELHRDNLALLEQKRDKLKVQAERILEIQIRKTLNSLDIYHPLDNILRLKPTFPPVKLRLEAPPKLLIISPRDRIERLDTITLTNDMTLDNIEELENGVSQLEVSSLVVDLGGIATYPSFVANRYGLEFAISTAVEEWMHQYLFFSHLGFRYGLKEAGLALPDYIAVMNETLAGMVSDEIGSIICDTYYAGYFTAATTSDSGGEPGGFGYTSFMRETRTTVDSLLADGKVEDAESYMEERRLILTANGYYIRKLNQAFFAFYGSYADQPGFENPIANNLKALRARSATLAEFLRQASGFTNPDELAEAIE